MRETDLTLVSLLISVPPLFARGLVLFPRPMDEPLRWRAPARTPSTLGLRLLFMCCEVMLLPLYFLIGIWGGPRREYAAIKFFLYTLCGGVLMLVAMLAFYFTDVRDFKKSDPRDFTTDASGKIVSGN